MQLIFHTHCLNLYNSIDSVDCCYRPTLLHDLYTIISVNINKKRKIKLKNIEINKIIVNFDAYKKKSYTNY